MSGPARPAGPLSRLGCLWRSVYPGGNPLARGADRLELGLIALGVVICVLAIPIGAAVASNVHARQALQAEEQLSLRYPTEAVLLADAPIALLGPHGAGRGGVREVPARWSLADGTQGGGLIGVNGGMTAGSVVTIWLDEQGRRVQPPMTPAAIVIATVTGTCLAWFGLVAVLAALFVPARFALDRYRYRCWERGWQRVSADWSRG